ncbi:MAG TPA: sigma-70 family RNA polymerase sigma factor [Polyangiales bacterium]|nr:sigma-70 family RNA polymerase sigma factor [Polyangiales bacterium]
MRHEQLPCSAFPLRDGQDAGAAPSGGERIGVEVLFREHAQFVATFLHRLGTPSQDVEDLLQEVFVVAHRKGGFVKGPAQPRSWLGAIATNVARTGQRTRRRRREDADSPALERLSMQAPSEIESLARVRLERALAELPLEQRAAFVLFELEGESCESIAAVWGVPVGTVYSRLHHARRRFLEAYECARDALSARRERGRP